MSLSRKEKQFIEWKHRESPVKEVSRAEFSKEDHTASPLGHGRSNCS